MTQQIKITSEYQQCFDYIDDDIPVIFVSGEAGTGKSVLINQIEKRYPIRVIIKVAPTGIAALHIGGQTIHSFFRIPTGVLTEKRILNVLSKMMKYGTGAYDTIDLLIIEEISMVRADMLDAINLIMQRMCRSSDPFGGVQTLMVGDLFQLPPVVTEEDEEQYFDLYSTEYFFGSRVFQTIDTLSSMEVTMLTEVFRQKDEFFVNILNEIRVNKNTKRNIKILNELCYYEPCDWAEQENIILCTTNLAAQHYNNSEMRKIKSPLFTYTAEITGKFNVKMVTPEELDLKIGAKVMFTKNGDHWVNGSMAEVVNLTPNSIEVKLVGFDDIIVVPKVTWEIKKNQYNMKKMKHEEVIVGTFKQYPLTQAWAVTIHKAQGLSFPKVTIDFGREAFAYGQVYVALSRCRSLDGIRLLRPLDPYDVKIDPAVVEFYKKLYAEYLGVTQ